MEANNVNAVKTWFEGPCFLWRPATTWNINKSKGRISAEDPEVKKEAHIHITSLKDDILSRRYTLQTDFWNGVAVQVHTAIKNEINRSFYR